MLQTIIHDHFSRISGTDWLMAGAIALGLFALLAIVRRLLISQLGRVARRTQTQVDDALVTLVRRTRPLFLLSLSLYLGSRWLPFNRGSDVVHIRQLFTFIAIVQAGLWGAGLATFFTERSLAKRANGTDRIGTAAVRTLGVGAKAIVWIIAILTAIELLEPNFPLKTVLTSLGVGGVALALAVQNILGDILATLAIAFDRPFDVGDTIAVDQISGEVERVGLKTTRLRSTTGEEVILANGDLIKSRIRNYTRMSERRMAMIIDLAADTPADAVERVPAMLRAIVEAEPRARFERSHFATITDTGFRTETIYYVLDRKYAKYMEVNQAIALAVVRGLGAQGIRFAFANQTLYAEPATARGTSTTVNQTRRDPART